MTTTPETDVKNYTWRDPEYHKIYNKNLYEQKRGKDCTCDRCGKVVRFCHIDRHQQTAICKKTQHKQIEDRKNNINKTLAQIEKMLMNVTDFFDSDTSENIL